MADLQEIYEPFASDFFEAYGQFGKPVRPLSREQANRAICASLAPLGDEAFLDIQAGKPIPTRAPIACVNREKQEVRIGRFIWELSRLSSGKYLATRTARATWPDGPMSSGHAITTEERDGLVLTTVIDTEWDCPLDPEDPCQSFDIDDTRAEIRCLGDQKTVCSEGGFYSAIYVAEIATQRSLTFGQFVHRPVARATVTSDIVRVTAGDCVQSVKRPWPSSTDAAAP